MIEQLEQAQQTALDELRAITTVEALRTWRGRYLGKQSIFAEISKGMGQVAAAERPVVGQRMNVVKQALEAAYADSERAVQALALALELESEQVDVTMPGRPVALGRLHPSTQVMREIETIFARMGFSVWESPEVETDTFNFALLNIPANHPARDMWDTFYVQTDNAHEKVVLRTHTSPGQIHSMRHFAPGPTRVILPGKCYRYEAVDATHEMMFHQIEGIAVGPQITMADLKGTLEQFAKQLLGPDAQIRFRPSYFPFTEPSVEVDVKYGNRGWLEVLGAGMIHPTVLRNGGYDPDQVSGFAFGMGPERLALLKYGIDDIRHFFSDDVRFLEQF